MAVPSLWRTQTRRKFAVGGLALLVVLLLARHQRGDVSFAGGQRHLNARALILSRSAAAGNADLRAEIGGMRAREIKAELTENGVDTSDLFDKEDLATRLYELRTGAIHGAPSKTTPSSEAGDVKAEEDMEEAPSAEDFVARCRAMAVKELRTELGTRNIKWADALDKEDLVQRLAAVLAKEAAVASKGPLRPGEVTKITGPQLREVLASPQAPLLLDVYATWCGPCKFMEPEMAKVARRVGDKVLLAKLDSDEENEVSDELQIRGLPTLILFDKTGKEKHRMEGAMVETQIMKFLEEELK